MPKSFAAAAAALLVVAVGCGILAVNLRQSPTALSSTDFAIPADDPQLGRRVYVRCQACHGLEGEGVPGNYPPLRASAVLNGDPARAISVVLNGVPRQTFNGAMPAFGDLADHEVAAVLTWARSQWGNHAAAITATDVAQRR
jgi:mono/diheme cytochrome c family protein